MDLTQTIEAVPQFGLCEAGAPYIDRPCAFGIALDDQARIAVVRIARETYVNWDLPGGMIDPGESEAEALAREFCEETGWTVRPGALVTRAEQFTITRTGERRRNQCGFFLCALDEMTDGKIEDDHELVWLDPHEALLRLRHEAAAWAVTQWLRMGRVCGTRR
ncbi:NUDIX domain-containing protein [Maricaulis sp.]|uniref:NUDIX domain-containing protein n=1 Tax=Maricaulis sp. TaxID=1486257 RepID=UPI003A918F3F